MKWQEVMEWGERRENKGRFYNRRDFVSKWLAGLFQVRKNSIHSPKLQRPKMSSLIVLKSQSQESFGGGWRMSEWGKGKRKTSRRRKNKRRNPRQGKGTRGPQRPRSVRRGDHDPWSKEANRAGPHSAARRTMDRARRGRGPHPSRGGRKKRSSGRCLALSRFGDCSTLQPCCPSALGPDTEGERITPSVPIFRPQRPRGGTSESRPHLGLSLCYPSSPPDGGMYRAPGWVSVPSRQSGYTSLPLPL